MRHRSLHGGRHELGQNFLVHRPTIRRIVDLVAAVPGPILEIGAGDGALTVPLARLGRDVRALELDEHRARALRTRLPGVDVRHADALQHPFDRPVVVGNLPFHLTTPLLRRLLGAAGWHDAVLLVQWEVARKRAGVGGRTLMTAQAAPWYEFALHGRVAAACFAPAPSVDGGILGVRRRPAPLVPVRERAAYERFAREVFTGRGGRIARILEGRGGARRDRVRDVLAGARIDPGALPRDLDPGQWAALWRGLRAPR